MYVTGIGRTRFGVLEETLSELAYRAASEALRDAAMGLDEVDAVYVANFCAGPTQKQLHVNALIADALSGIDVPVVRVEAACASGGAALYQALIASSRFDRILVIGIEKLSVGSREATAAIAMAGDRLLDQRQGLTFPASYALIAQQHMLKYGTTPDDLALISLKNHENANRNEHAHFYGAEVDLDKIMCSVVVCPPLRLYDCSPLSDGACALVLTNDRRSDRDVEVVASALASGNLALANSTDVTRFPAVRKAAREAYDQAGLSAGDIDVFQVHDCFTIAELIAMEDLGICEPGHSAGLVREGRTGIDGDIPINTDGGLKADGHAIGASGLAEVFEVVTQLRQEAGDRQVPGASVGLTHNVGGVGGTAAVHIFKAE